MRRSLLTGMALGGLALGWLVPMSPAFGQSSTTTTTTTPTTTTTTTSLPPTTTTTTLRRVPPAPTLSLGSTGAAVVTIQRRLIQLGYWLGPPNGTFGDSTQQAVYALQKAASIQRDGIVGPETRAALQRGVRPSIRPASGNLVEVNLGDDLLMIIRNGRLLYTLNTSTGGGYTYYSQGTTAVADTPLGVFHVYREVDGYVIDPLGELWRPKYFDDGFAIHGDSYVPPFPVSHGCVRVSDEAINWIWSANLMPIGIEVWVYA